MGKNSRSLGNGSNGNNSGKSGDHSSVRVVGGIYISINKPMKKE